MRAYERFLKYARINTESAEGTGTSPSTARQWDLANVLMDELKELGLQDVKASEFGVVTAVLPATPGCEDAPALGLLAHMDTAPAFSGANVEPILHENYDGNDIVLPKEGRVLRVADFPVLTRLKGRTLITADGSTLLGADDKAGIAEIMTVCEQIIAENIPHGKLCISFTPDEEIGEGTDHFDTASFGAKYAYTVDGGPEGEIEYENFNAASAKINITGVSVHPGSAKDAMENALLIAIEINAALPAEMIPAKTDGYDGFFHLDELSGSVADAQMFYIIRDHDMEKFNAKKAMMEQAVKAVQEKHPKAEVVLDLKDSYYNMAGQLKDCMHLIENARTAIRAAGLEPITMPIRGGTDGARLSFMGLPCPNLGTGGFNFHGPYEFITVEGMDKSVEILRHIVELYREHK
ncbi:MAG: peptidase T [Oscillospiraceae bacterium]|nr:peptidase T [Oscillospiraceae bacterium]